MLIAPGRSLGGARPKASVIDERGQLWIAKFPSGRDSDDIGGWEGVLSALARRAGIVTAESTSRRFGSQHHTFLARRFDRADAMSRIVSRFVRVLIVLVGACVSARRPRAEAAAVGARSAC
jgi:serine/threonine-protein kinase HipA